MPFIPDLSKGSDNESDEDVRFTYDAKGEVEESILMIRQIEETEKVKKALISNTDKERKKQTSSSSSANSGSASRSSDSSQTGSSSKAGKKKNGSSSSSTSPTSSVLASEAASDNDDDSLSADDKANGKQPKKSQKSLVKAQRYFGKRCGSTACKQGFIRDANDKYTELRCSAGCRICLHPKCSKKLDTVHKIENSGQNSLEKFSLQCPTPDCWGTVISISYYNKAQLEDSVDLGKEAAAAAAEAIALKNAEAKAAPKLSKKALKRKLRASAKNSDANISASIKEEEEEEEAYQDKHDATEKDDGNGKDGVDSKNDKDGASDEKKKETSQDQPKSQTSPAEPTKISEDKESADKKDSKGKDKAGEANATHESPSKEQQKPKEPTAAAGGASPESDSIAAKKDIQKKKPKIGGISSSPLTAPAQPAPLASPAPPVQLPINNEWANADAILKIKNGPSGVPAQSAGKQALGSSTPSQAGASQEHSSLTSLPLSSSTLHNQGPADKKDSNTLASAADAKGLAYGSGAKRSPQGYALGEGADGTGGRNAGRRCKSIYSIFLPYDYGDEKLVPLECPAWPKWSPLKSIINSTRDSFIIDITEGDPKACADVTNFKSFFGTTFDEDEGYDGDDDGGNNGSYE